MKKTTRKRTNNKWYPLSELPEGFFRRCLSDDNSLVSVEEALTLSPVFAALRLYQTTVGSLPLITYRKGDKGRERAREHPAYKILSERPNPAQSRSTFMEYLVKELFLCGEAFVQIQWAANNRLLNLFPISASLIQKIELDSLWRKTYYLVDGRSLQDDEVIHVIGPYSRDGIRGVSFFDYAASNLGLHKQVQDAANAYYKNSIKPSFYLSFPGKLDKQAAEMNKKAFTEENAGAKNRGKMPVFQAGGEVKPFPNNTAEEAELLAALNTSVADIARWFGVSPLMLADLTRGTYSNVGADNLAFYQKSVAPLLSKITLEVNHKIFGADAEFYCEFLVQQLLEADPQQQHAIYQQGIQAGYYLRSEVRDWLNLPFIEGLDQPLYPLNMGPEMAKPEEKDEPKQEDTTDGQSENTNESQAD